MIDMSAWPAHLRERQEANIRVATVDFEVTMALGRVAELHPDLCYEEVLDALLIVAARQVAHMRAPDDPTTTVDAPVLPKE